MRRLIVLAAAALFVWAPNAAAAETAPPDPVRALKSQLRAERGVTFNEVSRTTLFGDTSRTRHKGGLQLGPSGPVAAYLSVQDVPESKEEEAETADVVIVGRDAYLTSPAFVAPLPKGKSWIGGKGIKVNMMSFASEQTINVFDPAVLKAALKGAKVKSVSGGYLYQGAVTYAELYKAAKSYYSLEFEGKSRSSLAKAKVSFRLWTDKQGLIKRLMSSTASEGVDTSYSEWGRPLIIEAPAAAEVLGWDDLKDLRIELPDGHVLDSSAYRAQANLGLG
jgi:hypothetical protein